MAIEIIWSVEADEAFSQNVNYLSREWSDKEVANFVLQIQKVTARLQIFPESYPHGNKNKKYRKARLNKYTVLFYLYSKSKRTITIITLWNVKQDPDKLKY